MDNLVKMYGMRTPYKSELDFFKGRPEVAGIAHAGIGLPMLTVMTILFLSLRYVNLLLNN